MDRRKFMVIINNEIKTDSIQSCYFNNVTKKWDVKFNGTESIYSYNLSKVKKLEKPVFLNPKEHKITTKKCELFEINEIYLFENENNSYYHIFFKNGKEKSYLKKDLYITTDTFEYIKKIANLNSIKNQNTKNSILYDRLNNISFINDDLALAKYLEPTSTENKKKKEDYIPIFPFGCNNSQYKAVKNSMENQITVIQGPPGTGKTQTILNIISNILMEDKTVQVVSNSNSATENIYEKLASQDWNLSFIAAQLGSEKKKEEFINNQNIENLKYPPCEISDNNKKVYILQKSKELKRVFDKHDKLACLKQELSQVVTEKKYFDQFMKELNLSIDERNFKKKLSSKKAILFWQECQMFLEEEKTIGFWFKIKSFLRYGLNDWNISNKDIYQKIIQIQSMYYNSKQFELSKEIKDIEEYLKGVDQNLLKDLSDKSMDLLKNRISEKYKEKKIKKKFTLVDLQKKSDEFLRTYPVILSTTFSSRSSLNSEVIYDYIIIDEASQVDIATGILALSCARNAVIVGDTKQLPNIVQNDTKVKAEQIFQESKVNEGYHYEKSFLQSILNVMPNIPQVLLREHYRCHPKIINFCNQKFYGGEMIIMTSDNDEKNVLSVVKTVVGNHERDHTSQRQVDIIEEIKEKYANNPNELGIITPYLNQVNLLKEEAKDIEISSVHKFQGREKENIIISTVDDEISDFADNPYLINVAVSRAKKQLILVVTGNEQQKKGNIMDLIDYITYNNFEVVESKTRSIFDYLYKQYEEERKKYLKKHKKISEFDSENLMHLLIKEILSEDKYSNLDVIPHSNLIHLIKDVKLLNPEEKKYASNPATHLDFLIYNKLSKKPVLGIEVDGYKYHKKNIAQAKRDSMKDNIMKLYEIPFQRFLTNGSDEKIKIIKLLDEILGK